MLRKLMVLAAVAASSSLFAAQSLDLYSAPLSSLKPFQVKKNNRSRSAVTPSQPESTLNQVNQTVSNHSTIVRYQQMYHGIPVIGAQVMVNNNQVNGHLLNDLQVNTTPAINSSKATALAKKAFFSEEASVETHNETSQLQIRAIKGSEFKLTYLVSFRCLQKGKPAWPFLVVDAQSGEILSQWNNMNTYVDSGPGGNDKTHEYWYGKDGLPGLNVTQKGTQCVMQSPSVKLVDVNYLWDWSDDILTPFEYACAKNNEENVNGAFSTKNDAYYFGQVIVDMYKNWYGVKALQHQDGTDMQLVMRVHFGKNLVNAFWDGEVMSFGDGDREYYPLVSLDIAGHEVTHGFTQQHSGLEYHDQSGGLNESLSDMGGQAARAYLLETNPILYSKMFLDRSVVNWLFGETIVKEGVGKALRFMDFPSSDGVSADCLDKGLAQSNGSYCAISYEELVAFTKANVPQNLQQDFIVHTASGVFNKAFYLMSKDFGIKETYHMMIVANSKYWTPTTEFIDGACGVLHAGKDVHLDLNKIRSAFNQVGVSTANCPL